jgi:5-methylcytosine-specific restriction endonuclease McrA
VSDAKACTRCGETKPLEGFPRDKRYRDDRSSWCRDCHRASNREANRKRRSTAEGREIDRAASRRAKRKRYATPEGREEERQRNREYHRKLRATPEGREASRAAARKRRATPEGLEASRAANRKVYATPEGQAAHRARMHARRAAEGSYTARDWLRLVNRFGGRCAYCGKQAEVLHADHVVPLSRGGTSWIGNVLPACAPCNLSKGSKLLVEWRRTALAAMRHHQAA